MISFSIAITLLSNCISLLKIGLNDQFNYCFLAVTIFTSNLFIGFYINLPNVVLFFNLVSCFLILSPYFPNSVGKSVMRLSYGFKTGSYLNSNIL